MFENMLSSISISGMLFVFVMLLLEFRIASRMVYSILRSESSEFLHGIDH